MKRRGLSAATLVLSVLVLVTGCGGDTTAEEAPGAPDSSTSTSAPTPAPGSTEPSSASATPTQEPSEPADDTVVVEVDVSGGAVTPDGDRISVERGQTVEIVVTSDVAGELHVHSSPESYEQFAAGDNAPIELTFDRPGLVDVELHEPFEGPVVQLEVS